MAQREECDEFYAERRARILHFVMEQTPFRSIAAMEGMDYDACRKLCAQIAREAGVVFDVEGRAAAPVVTGINDSNAQFRRRLGDALHEYCRPNPRHERNPSMVGKAVGIPPKSQRRAWEKPFSHDWQLSQMTRLAEARGESFRQLMLRSLLDSQEYEKVARALNL